MKNLGLLILVLITFHVRAQQCIVTNAEDSNAPGTLPYCLENTTANIVSFSPDLKGDTIVLGVTYVSRDIKILGDKRLLSMEEVGTNIL